MRRHLPIRLPWEDLPEPALGALEKVLRSWEGTPYVAGQACKGVGVDCVRFILEVLRELEGWPSIPLVEIPQDASMHNREGSMAAFKKIIQALEPIQRVSSVQPGDILVIGPAQGGPGHGLIVGPRKNTLYHAAPSGVSMTGLGMIPGYKIFGVYRKGSKSLWGVA